MTLLESFQDDTKMRFTTGFLCFHHSKKRQKLEYRQILGSFQLFRIFDKIPASIRSDMIRSVSQRPLPSFSIIFSYYFDQK